MKFSVGDKVILNENGDEAEVIGILTSKVIEVLSYGMEFPVRITDVHAPESKSATEISDKPLMAEKKQQKNEKKLQSGFYFSFQPMFADARHEEIVSISLAFLNRSDRAVMLEFSCHFQRTANSTETQKSIVAPSGQQQLMTIPMSDMNDKPKFDYKIYPVEDDVRWAQGNWFQVSESLMLQPRKLFKYLSEMQLNQEESFEILLAEAAKSPTPDVSASKTVPSKKTERQQNRKKQNRQQSGKRLDEVDLHAESLGIPIHRLSNFEILSRQMQALEEAIDRAVLQRQTSLIVIHGVGTGKLKEEVHLLLNGHPSVTFYQHTWRPKYGWGATEAFLK